MHGHLLAIICRGTSKTLVFSLILISFSSKALIMDDIAGNFNLLRTDATLAVG